MAYRVTIYAPDRHLVYDAFTPDHRGIGGGVTVRIRLARALARLGHHVTVVCNCPSAVRAAGVSFVPLGHVRRIEADVVILSSSAGTPDLTPALSMGIAALLRVVRVDGTPMPRGLQELPYDYLYSPSNFVRQVARDEWGVPPAKLVVFHNGVEPALLREAWWASRSLRHPRRLLYCGHPDKGLQAALGVLRMLRGEDRRFELHAFGGDGLYGKPDRPFDPAPGFYYHGTIGQRRLYHELRRGAFSLSLQARPEPFGLVLVESMAAGCVSLASPVGAYPEIVRHGYDGFLISGEHLSADTWEKAADLIRTLVANPDFAGFVSRNARAGPLSWDRVARSMEGHWRWTSRERGGSADEYHGEFGWVSRCGECVGMRIALSDGYHCTACGAYRREP